VSARELAPSAQALAAWVSARARQAQGLAASVSARALWPPAQEPVSAWAQVLAASAPARVLWPPAQEPLSAWARQAPAQALVASVSARVLWPPAQEPVPALAQLAPVWAQERVKARAQALVASESVPLSPQVPAQEQAPARQAPVWAQALAASVSTRERAPVQAVSVSAWVLWPPEQEPASVWARQAPARAQALAASVSARALWPPAQEPLSAWARQAPEQAPVQVASVSVRAVSESVPLSPPVPAPEQVPAASASALVLWPPERERAWARQASARAASGSARALWPPERAASVWARAQLSVQGLVQALAASGSAPAWAPVPPRAPASVRIASRREPPHARQQARVRRPSRQAPWQPGRSTAPLPQNTAWPWRGRRRPRRAWPPPGRGPPCPSRGAPRPGSRTRTAGPANRRARRPVPGAP